MRLFGTLIGSVFLYTYPGWSEAWLWPLGVFGMHAIQFAHYQLFRKTGGKVTFLTVVVLTQLSLLAFIWMPVAMLLDENEVVRICGSTIMGALIVYLMHTADRSRIIIWGQVAVMTLVVLGVFWVVFPRHPDMLGRAAMIYTGAIFIIYLAICLYTARRRRQANDALAERTAQSQKMEAIGQLAGGVAHDFNNMLTAVIGNLDLYDAIDDPLERKQFINDARDAAIRGQKVVEQLLHFSRLSPHDPKTRSAAELMSEIEKLQRHLLPASVDLEIHVETGSLRVWVDENLFLTAMINLMSNAADAIGRSGTLQITVSDVRLNQPKHMLGGNTLRAGSYASFSVHDTGPGIPSEVLARVAEPFFTSKPVGQGSGLGLATASGFAERSGGGLMIETSSMGTTATILLPTLAEGQTMPQKTAALPTGQPRPSIG